MIIDVWSDVVCPWCFIGRRRLEAAVAKLPAGTLVDVRHRAFQLDPSIREAVPTAQMLADKYNLPPDHVAQMQERVCRIADGVGLCFDLGTTLSGNTADAHRLLLWAAEQGSQGALLEVMYSSYFELGGSLFDRNSLLALVASVGLEPKAAADVLDGDAFRDDVVADQRAAQRLGATGVPFVVVEGRYAISGAQEQSVFDDTLRAALAQ